MTLRQFYVLTDELSLDTLVVVQSASGVLFKGPIKNMLDRLWGTVVRLYEVDGVSRIWVED